MTLLKSKKYGGNIYVKMIDDGSTDGTLELLNSMDLNSNITLIETKHQGKANALNQGLQTICTDYTITIDSDTVLHPLAVRNIMHKLVNSNKKTAAIAGCLFVKKCQKELYYKNTTMGLYFRYLWCKANARELPFHISCTRCF